MRDYVAEWQDECREFVLACDSVGSIVWMDTRARAREIGDAW